MDGIGHRSFEANAEDSRAVIGYLQHGEITGCQPVPYGSNYTFVLSIESHSGEDILAIYKPRSGEIPLWDFPDGTLYRREYAAYLTSQVLGWDFIPPTVIRNGPHGVGTVQLYIEPDLKEDFFQFRKTRVDDLVRIALFDLITNNADRKAGHCIMDASGKIWGIDHGLTFHTVTKLRTVLWEFCQGPVPAGLLGELESLMADDTRTRQLRECLAPLIDRREIAAFFSRIERVIRLRRFPRPESPRVPWPPF